MGYADLGCFGSTNNSSPHIDSLARDGLRFTQWMSAASICTPSRAAMQTGRLPARFGMTANSLPWRVLITPDQPTGLPDSELTVATLLKRKGYSTGMSGKWHLGLSNKTTQWAHLPRQHGYDSWLGMPYSNMLACKQGQETDFFCLMMANNTVVQQPFKAENMTQEFTRHAIDFLEWNAAGGDYPASSGMGSGAGTASSRESNAPLANGARKPFFFMFNFMHVHTPLFSSPRFTNVSAGGPFGDNVAEMDDAVGQVLAALDRLGLANDTLVLLTSDNGPYQEEGWQNVGRTGVTQATRLKGGKGQVWEGGLRMPAVARWPGRVAPGKTTDALVGSVDILPTLLSLAGEELPSDRHYDGRDMAPVLFAAEPATAPSAHEFMFHYCGSNVTAVRHIVNGSTYKLHLASQVWQSDKRPSPLCIQCCPYDWEHYEPFGGGGSLCNCAGKHITKHDPPLVFRMDDDKTESNPISRDAFPGGASAFDTEIATVKAALAEHYATVAPSPDQMKSLPNKKLQPCCTGGLYKKGNCNCDLYVPGRAYP